MATSTRRPRSGSHLVKRGDTYHYRRAVPADARAAFDCWEVTRSLHTSSETEAQRLEKAHDVEFERRLREIRQARNPEYVAEQITNNIRLTNAGRVLRGGFGMTGRIVAADLSVDDQEKVRTTVAGYLEKLRDQGEEVQSLFQEIGDLLAKPVGGEVLPQLRAAMRSMASHYVPESEQIQPAVAAAPIPGFCAFRTIFEKWEKEQRPASKTIYSWKKIIGKLVAHSRGVASVTEGQLMAWNAASLTEQDVIAWKDALVSSKLNPTTIGNHLTILRTIYHYASRNRLVDPGVANGVCGVRFKAKKKPGTKRRGYTEVEARAILIAARQERDPVLRWSPWLAAHMGARIDEICGGMVADIETIDGVPCFHIRLDHRGEDAAIKSENAERTVPIHTAVIAEGFLDYVAGLPKEGPLFPDLKPDRFGRRGGNGSKRVGRWIRDRLKITDPRKAPSHSWRHRFRTLLRNPELQIGEDVVDYLCGHGGTGGEGRKYGEYAVAAVATIRKLPSVGPE